MDFREALSQYLNTMTNYIHHSSYVIILNILFLTLSLVHESLPLLNDTNSIKAADQGAIKESCKQEKLGK